VKNGCRAGSLRVSKPIFLIDAISILRNESPGSPETRKTDVRETRIEASIFVSAASTFISAASIFISAASIFVLAASIFDSAASIFVLAASIFVSAVSIFRSAASIFGPAASIFRGPVAKVVELGRSRL
jgi:Co/Zn/Cd efflux system component